MQFLKLIFKMLSYPLYSGINESGFDKTLKVVHLKPDYENTVNVI